MIRGVHWHQDPENWKSLIWFQILVALKWDSEHCFVLNPLSLLVIILLNFLPLGLMDLITMMKLINWFTSTHNRSCPHICYCLCFRLWTLNGGGESHSERSWDMKHFPPHLNYKITSNKLKGFEENSGPTYGFRSLLDSSQIALYLLMKQKKYFTLLIHSKYFALSDWLLPITWLTLHHQLTFTIFGRIDANNIPSIWWYLLLLPHQSSSLPGMAT